MHFSYEINFNGTRVPTSATANFAYLKIIEKLLESYPIYRKKESLSAPTFRPSLLFSVEPTLTLAIYASTNDLLCACQKRSQTAALNEGSILTLWNILRQLGLRPILSDGWIEPRPPSTMGPVFKTTSSMSI